MGPTPGSQRAASGDEVVISDEPEFGSFAPPVVAYNPALREYLVVWGWRGKSQGFPEARPENLGRWRADR
jgi:hypothetical protein